MAVQEEKKHSSRKTHGMGATKEYLRWYNMLQRCLNESHPAYKNYGGRGIRVCREWLDFSAFNEWAVGCGYKDGDELDRVDNSKGYYPENCRFVSHKENNRNRRDCVLVTAFGETKTATEWSEDERCSVSRSAITRRLKSGMNPELAIVKQRR